MKKSLSSKEKQEIFDLACSLADGKDLLHCDYHARKTVYYATLLAEREGADVELCQLMAMLHDISKGSSDHGRDGAIKAAEILRGYRLEESSIKQVCEAIKSHMHFVEGKSLEAMILWDADKLQGVGPRALLLQYTRHLNDGKSWEEAIPAAKENLEYYYDKFYTESAKKIAQILINKSKLFFDDLKQDIYEGLVSDLLN